MTDKNTNETLSDSDISDALKVARSEVAEAPKAKRMVLSSAERQVRDQARRDAVEGRKLARLEKKANKPERAPAHMVKVAKAAEKLPALDQDTSMLIEDILESNSTATVQAIIAHLQHQVRTQQTLRAVNAKLEVGQLVRIVTHSDSKHIGLLGHVVEVRRIRSHVQPLDAGRPVYVFNSDVEVVTDASALAEAAALENVG